MRLKICQRYPEALPKFGTYLLVIWSGKVMVAAQDQVRPPCSTHRSARPPKHRFVVKESHDTERAQAHDGMSLWDAANVLAGTLDLGFHLIRAQPPRSKKKKRKGATHLARFTSSHKSVDTEHANADLAVCLATLFVSPQRPPTTTATTTLRAEHTTDDFSSAARIPTDRQLNDDEALELLGIRTSDDAINFFSSHSGGELSIKFVHLMNATNIPHQFAEALHDVLAGRELMTKFRPYDLIVLPPRVASSATLARLGVEYFTMSTEGLVRMGEPGVPSEFIPLTQWMREAACFNMLTSIPFFRDYLVTKSFRAWRTNVSYKMYRRQRKRLATHLFLAIPSFTPALLDLKKRMHEMCASTKLLDLSGGYGNPQQTGASQTKLLDSSAQQQSQPEQQQQLQQRLIGKDINSSFENRQQKSREAASKVLNDALDDAAKLVHAACLTVIASSRQDTEPKDDPNEQDVVSQVLRAFEQPAPPRSMAAKRDLEAATQAARRQSMHERSLLPDFVRLSDHVAVESLVQLVIISWSELQLELAKPRRQAGMLETQVRFSDSASTFHPTCTFLQNLISNIGNELVTTVSKVLRILYVKPRNESAAHSTPDRRSRTPRRQRKAEEQHTKSEENTTPEDVTSSAERVRELGELVSALATARSQPNLVEILAHSSEFRSISKQIDEKIEADFAKAHEYVETAFDKVWQIYDESRKWDMEAFKAKAQTVVTLKQELEKVTAWQRELDKMRTRSTVGMLEVESRKLRDMLIPITRERMEQLKEHTRNLTRAKCRDQLTKFKAAIVKIQMRPTDLDQFSVLLERLEEQRNWSRSLSKHTQLTEQLCHLLKEYEVKLPEAEIVQMDELRTVQASYNEELEASNNFCATTKPTITAQLDECTVDFGKRLVTLSDELESGVLVDVAAGFVDPSVPIKVLEAHVKQNLDTLAKVDADLKKKSKLFNRAATPEAVPVPYKKVAEKFNAVKMLWLLIERWDQDVNSWLHDDFIALNTNNMLRQLKLYHQGGQTAAKKLPQHPVAKELLRQTDMLQEKMCVVESLGSTKLDKHHWSLLFEKVGRQCPPDLHFTLDELLKAGLHNHVNYVKQIAERAADETIITECSLTLKDMLAHIEMT